MRIGLRYLIISLLLFPAASKAAFFTNNKLNLLFNSSEQIAANYTPVLALRAFYNAKFYRKKRKARLTREFYFWGSNKPFETLRMNIESKPKGFTNLIITATGSINNDIKVTYSNYIEGHLNKTANMSSQFTVGGEEILNLQIYSNANKKTNKVTGQFMKRPVSYTTIHRNTKGTLAGIEYQMYVEGKEDEKTDQFTVFCEGSFAGIKITGEGHKVTTDTYSFEEKYGYITVKTYLEFYD